MGRPEKPNLTIARADTTLNFALEAVPWPAQHSAGTPRNANKSMSKTYKHCQSCGMPLKRDEHGGGTNADGSKSGMYCSHCYQDGRFVIPNTTVEETQTRVRQKLKEFGFPGFLCGLFTRRIPRLDRWRTTAP